MRHIAGGRVHVETTHGGRRADAKLAENTEAMMMRARGRRGSGERRDGEMREGKKEETKEGKRRRIQDRTGEKEREGNVSEVGTDL